MYFKYSNTFSFDFNTLIFFFCSSIITASFSLILKDYGLGLNSPFILSDIIGKTKLHACLVYDEYVDIVPPTFPRNIFLNIFSFFSCCWIMRDI